MAVGTYVLSPNNFIRVTTVTDMGAQITSQKITKRMFFVKMGVLYEILIHSRHLINFPYKLYITVFICHLELRIA